MQFVKQSAVSRRTGQTTVTTTAAPITQIGNASGAGTTFTVTTGIDAVAWDLSDVVVGDVAVTSDGCAGLIIAVNDGTNTITVQGWYCPGTGWNLDSRVEASVPAAGSTITILRRTHVRLLGLKADSGNTANIGVGLHGAAVVTDYVLGAGETVAVVAEPPNKFIDLTQVYAIAASGSQTLHWIVGGKPGLALAAGVLVHTHALAAGATDVTAIAAELNLLDLAGMTVGDVLVATGAASAAWIPSSTLTWGAFVDGDATPDVSAGINWKTANTAPTTITNFDNPAATGQLIRILFGDANTIIEASANIRLQGGIASPANDYSPSVAGDILEFVYDGVSQWVETNRSMNS